MVRALQVGATSAGRASGAPGFPRFLSPPLPTLAVMGFEVTTVAYGPPALGALAGAVAEAKGGDALRSVTVVVPSNYAAVAGRRALAAVGPGVAAVSFLTLHRLAERLGGTVLAASGRRPVSGAVVGHAVGLALAEAPGMFGPVAGHPATEEALVAAHRELAAVGESHLRALSAASARAAEVVRIHRRVAELLAPAWHDEHDLLDAATRALETEPEQRIDPVIVHLPQRLTSTGAGLLRALAHVGSVRVVVGLTGEAPADHALRRALDRAGISLGAEQGPAPAHAGRVLSVSDPDEEVRSVVRHLVAAARAGVPFSRMAVVYGSADPYVRLVHEHLAAAGIPHNGAPVRTIGQGLVGRSLRTLLALPDRGFRRSEVLALVSSSRLLDGDGRWAPARAWERVSRAAGVVEGDDWRHRLAAFATAQRGRAEEAEADERPSVARRHRVEADQADALAGFVARLRHRLAAGHSARSWAGMVEWAHDLLAVYVGAHDQRGEWPDEERRAGDRVEVALDGLAGLDLLGGPAPSLAVFRRTLERELETALSTVGRFGDGVLVGHVALTPGVCVDRLFVLGLAEGSFPGRRLEDSLLPDGERALTEGELELRCDRLHADRRLLLAALAGAGEATLCFPRGDLRRPGDRTASRWLLGDVATLADHAGPCTRDLATVAHHHWFEEVPSFAAGVTGCPFPASSQDYGLAALARGGPGPLASHPEAALDPRLAAGLALAEGRRSAAFTRFDGNLAGLELPDLTDGSTIVAATRLQSWASCPHAYLLEHVLRVAVVEDPERVLAITPLDRGSLVHTVLDRFLSEAISAGVPNGPWVEHHRARLRSIAEEVCDDYERRGLTGRRLFWRRDRARILAELDRFLDEDAAFRGSHQARPVATELTFGLGSVHRGPVPFALPDGRSVLFRGAADRVDATADGGLVVSDYKTGSAERYRGLGHDNPHAGGTQLQLAVYGAAARMAFGTPGTPVVAHYWFTSAKGEFERIGYAVDGEVCAEVGRALATIADGVSVGIFPARPAADPPWGYVPCWYCDPDGLGVRELRRSWERKRLDPVLADYVRLCEPEALDDQP